jgi:hypothetical protein
MKLKQVATLLILNKKYKTKNIRILKKINALLVIKNYQVLNIITFRNKIKQALYRTLIKLIILT